LSTNRAVSREVIVPFQNTGLFEELRCDALAQYAETDHRILFMGAVVDSELREPGFDRDAYLFGFVPTMLEEGWDKGYWIGSRKRLYGFDYAKECEAFHAFARRAGALLPINLVPWVRPPTNCASRWLSLLWNLFPPSDEDLTLDPERGVNGRILFEADNPFVVSARAIELCELNRPQPSWPLAAQTGLISTIKISKRVEVAYRAFLHACAELGTDDMDTTVRDAHNWTKARGSFGRPKYSKRFRTTSRSAVRPDQIETGSFEE
jgi:hypothetical protein